MRPADNKRHHIVLSMIFKENAHLRANAFAYSQMLETLGNHPNKIQLSNGKDYTFFEEVPSYLLNTHPFLKGGYSIPYYTLEGERLQFRRPSSGRFKQGLKDYFSRIRVSPDSPFNGKYWQYKESGARIYIPPKIIDAYQEGKKINRLFIIEGEKKTISATLNGGIYAIGTGGKDLFREKGSDELHPDLKKIINKNEVKELVLFLDNDFNQGRKNRRNNFYITIRNFIKACRKSGVLPVLMYLDQSTETKAIDDYYNEYPNNVETISQDIKKLRTTDHLKTIKLNEYSRLQLRNHILNGGELDQYFHISKGYISENKEVTSAVCKAIKEKDALILTAPTGKGKTAFIMNGQINKALKGFNIVMVAPLTAIAKQTEKEYSVQAIYSGSSYLESLTLDQAPPEKIASTYASIDKAPIDENTLLVIDEAHLCIDWSFIDYEKLIKAIAKAGKIIFLSATNDRLLKNAFPQLDMHSITITTNRKPIDIEVNLYNDNQREHLIQLLATNKEKEGKIIVKLDNKVKLSDIREELIQRGIYSAPEIAKFSALSEDEASKEYGSVMEEGRLSDEIKLILSTSKIQEGVNLKNEDISLIIGVDPKNPRAFVQLIGRARKSNKLRAIALFNENYQNKKGFFINPFREFQSTLEKLEQVPTLRLPKIINQESTAKEFHTSIDWKLKCLLNLEMEVIINPFAVINEVNQVRSFSYNLNDWKKELSFYGDYLHIKENNLLEPLKTDKATEQQRKERREYKATLKDKALVMVTDYTQLQLVASAVFVNSRNKSHKDKLQRVFGFTPSHLKDGDTFRKKNPELFELTKIEQYVNLIMEGIRSGLNKYDAMTLIELHNGSIETINHELNRITLSNLRTGTPKTVEGKLNIQSLQEFENTLPFKDGYLSIQKDDLLKILRSKCKMRFGKGTPSEVMSKIGGVSIVKYDKRTKAFNLEQIGVNYISRIKYKCEEYRKESTSIKKAG